MEFLNRIIAALGAFGQRVRAYLQAHATVSLTVFILIAVVLIVWARIGFTLDFSRFFAMEEGEVHECNRAGDTFCSGNKVMMWETDHIDGGCVSGEVEDCGAGTCSTTGGAHCEAPATPPPTTPTPATPTPTGPGVQVVITSTQPIKHGEKVNVMWSALWADSCTSSWVSTPSTEGSGQTNAIDACAGASHDVTIQCCDDVLGCGSGSATFTVDETTCPTSGVEFSMHFDGFHSTSNGVGYFENPTSYDEAGTYCVYEMVNGDFNNQVELARKLVTVKSHTNRQVALSDVWSGTCGPKVLQLDLIYAYDACGEAPYGHAGSVWDFVIGYQYNGPPCPSPSEPPPVSPSEPPPSSPPPVSPSEPPPSSPPPVSPSEPPTSPSQPPSSFRCEPETQTVDRNETAIIRAIGGTAPYDWSAPGSSLLDENDDRASVRYSSRGTYAVAVEDSAEHGDVCYVRVTGGGGGGSTDPDLEIIKLVRNITQNTAEQDSVTANPGNTVEFSLRVSSTGTATARDVMVRDSLPAGLYYVNGTTTIDGAPAPDGIVYSGISLGDMPKGTSKLVRFRVNVVGPDFFKAGTTLLTNTGFAKGSDVSEINDVAFVTITKTIIPPIVTGPGQTTVLALIISAIVTLLYVGYTGTDAFRRRELANDIDVARKEKDAFDFKR